MLSPRIVLSLALLPALVLAPACDDKQGPGTGDVTDDTTTDGQSSTADVPDGPPEPDTTEGEGATSSPEVPEGTDSEGDSEGESEGEDQPEPPPPAPRPQAVQPCDGWEWPHQRECDTEDGQIGVQVCFVHEGQEHYTECDSEELPACLPEDGWDMGCMGEICAFDGAELYLYSWSEDDCNTPLVLNFDGAPLRFDAASAASFDISGVGQCLSTDWPTLPWLALDRDRDGAIDSGRELFGSGTVLRSGRRAGHGFEALAEHDLNRDGKIDAADPVFAELVLWSDGDGDRRGELSELVPVAHVDLVAIHLDVAVRAECDDRGNCGRERARFEYRNLAGEVQSGEVVDVYLACQ